MSSIFKVRHSIRAIKDRSSDNSVFTHTSLTSQTPHTPHKPKISLGDRLPQLPAIPNLPDQDRATVKRLIPDRPFKGKRPKLDVLIIVTRYDALRRSNFSILRISGGGLGRCYKSY